MLRHSKRLNVLSWLLVLIITLVASGCSDEDREIGTAPAPSAGIVKYLFQQETESKVAAEMTTVSVTAFDKDWNQLNGASMVHPLIADMPKKGDYIVAEARVPEEATVLAYAFSNGTPSGDDDEAVEICVISLQEGKTEYTMSDNDELDDPVFAVYADAEHQTEQYKFEVGDELYPVVTVATKSGLKLSASVMQPVDQEVVAYTAATDTEPAKYVAKAEGSTAFILNVVNYYINSGSSVEVKPVTPPTPTPSPTVTPEPSPTVEAWVLPQEYELKQGLIYLGEDEVAADDVNTDLGIVYGENNVCQVIVQDSAEGDNVTYKLCDAEVTPSITSDTADHFTATYADGKLTVAVDSDAEIDETATIELTAEGYSFAKPLNVTVNGPTLREVTCKIPAGDYRVPRPSPTPSEMTSNRAIKAVAVDADGVPLRGTTLECETWEDMTTEGDYKTVKAQVPTNASALAIVVWYNMSEYTTDELVIPDYAIPWLGAALPAEDDEQTLTFVDDDKFIVTSIHDGDPYYLDEECSGGQVDSITVGTQIYVPMAVTTTSGTTLRAKGASASDTTVLSDSLKAVGAGKSFVVYDWGGGVQGFSQGFSIGYLTVTDD